MKKQEADTIIKACNKHKIKACIRREGDLYLVNFMERFEYRAYKAAQLMCNALVIEYKTRKAKVAEKKDNYIQGLNFSPYPTKRKRGYEPGNWGERHLKQNEGNSSSADED